MEDGPRGFLGREAEGLADARHLEGDEAQAVSAVEQTQEHGARRAERAIAVEDERDDCRTHRPRLRHAGNRPSIRSRFTCGRWRGAKSCRRSRSPMGIVITYHLLASHAIRTSSSTRLNSRSPVTISPLRAFASAAT